MSLDDKIKNSAKDIAGKAKEGLGDVTGVNQAAASAQDALSDAKDAAAEKAGKVADKAKGFINGLKK